jgi:hypothetical protein
MPNKQGAREQATPTSKDRSSETSAGSEGARIPHLRILVWQGMAVQG